MEVLVLDGKSYVKASKAAKNLGYATDYVGQLCRSGQVDAHLIGRTWYVNEAELGTHRTEKKRMSRVKAREYAKRSIEEYRTQTEKTTNTYKNIDIRYENDEESLIPETKKLTVQSDDKKHYQRRADDFPENKTVTINKGEKIIMSGDVPVVDVTDGEIDGDTTILKPHILKGVRKEVVPNIDDIPSEEPAEEIYVEVPKKLTFTDRLQAQSVNTTAVEPNEETIEEKAEKVIESTKEDQTLAEAVIPISEQEGQASPSIIRCFIIIIAACSIVVASLCVTSVSSYALTEEGRVTTSNTFRFSYTDTVSIIKLKI